jgi:UDP-2-acetamido-3-amino-2,3-dideoxy-glucuronate N-acetyltransferase
MVWHQAQLMVGSVMGAGCTVGKGAFVGTGSVLGSQVKVGNYANIMGASVEDEAFIGPQAYLMEDPRPRATNLDGSRRGAGDWQAKPVTVRRGATVGGGSLILPGQELGEWSMVAAGAVVHRDVPAFALVAGNPARQVGWVCRCGERLDEKFRCECGLAYRHEDGVVRAAEPT